MKTLFKENGIEIGVFDDRNYYVDGLKAQRQYYNHLQSAVKAVCRAEADEYAYNLASWLKQLRASLIYFEDIFEGNIGGGAQ